MTLTMYVVYDHPEDFPDQWVARAWEIAHGRFKPTPLLLAATTLEQLREMLPVGLARMGPDHLDDPVICEVWI